MKHHLTMRTASMWLLVALLVTKHSRGYPLVLQRHPSSPSIYRISNFGGRIRRVEQPVSLGAIHVNKNEAIKAGTNVTEQLNSTGDTDQLDKNLTKLIRNASGGGDVEPSAVSARNNDEVVKFSKQRLKESKSEHSGSVKNPFALFLENLARPGNSTRAIATPSQSTNSTRRSDEHLQSYLAYTFGSNEDRQTSTSKPTNRTNPTAVQKWIRSRRHHETNPVVLFFQRLMNRTSPTSSTPSSPRKTQRKPKRQHANINAISRFVQHVMHRNATTSSHSVGSTTVIPVPSTLSNQNVTASPWDSKENKYKKPVGPRWAIPSKTTNLSGKWKPILTPQFKKEYDTYLQNCGQSFAFRTLCLNFVGTTREVIRQDGNSLHIKGTNPVGVWERTLVSSGSDLQSAEYEPFNVTFLDPDKDTVNVEAWWEEEGTVHKSWLRGKKRVHGGEFESTRYLENSCKESENDGAPGVLVCESKFHPNGAKGFHPAFIKWRFERAQE